VNTILKRGTIALVATALTLLGMAAATPASAVQAGYPTMTNIRTGLNTGFDRIVLDMTGSQPSVKYTMVDELKADPSDQIVWLTGQFFVSVVASPARAHDDNGNLTYTGPDKFRTRNLRNVMAVALTGDFEGYLSIGLGIRSQTWVRVFTLASPTRVVIDVGN
jgi:hypothetical protein